MNGGDTVTVVVCVKVLARSAAHKKVVCIMYIDIVIYQQISSYVL